MIRKKLFCVALVLVLTLAAGLPIFAAAADTEAAGVHVLDGIRTVFASDADTVQYDGNDYAAFHSLSAALAALGSEGGRLLIGGTFTPTDNGSDGAFVDPARGNVVFSGVTGNETDTMVMSNRLNFPKGKITFDNFTMKMNTTKYLVAPQFETTENFKADTTNYRRLYLTSMDGIMTNVRQTLSGGAYWQINLLGSRAVGSSAANGYAYVTVNGGKYYTGYFNWGTGYGSCTVYGNLIYEINGGDLSGAGKSIRGQNGLTHTKGFKIALLNNGLGDSFTVAASDRADSLYVVRSAVGGKVTPDESTLAADNPVLIFTPDDVTTRPVFDGTALRAANGVYSVTVTGAGDHTVTWEEISEEKPQVYILDGVRCAFVSDDGASFTWNDANYVPYTSLTDAVAALGSDGGKILVNGTYTHTTFTDKTARSTVTFTGTDDEAVIVITSDSAALTLNKGAAVFDDIRFSVTESGKYIHGNGSIRFTENFRSNNSLYVSPAFYTDTERSEIYLYAGNYICVDALGSASTLGSAEKPSHASVYVNGATLNRVNGGWGWSAKPVYGNLFVYVNAGNVYSITANSLSTISGKRTVIFNNGLGKLSNGGDVPVAALFDFAVRSEKGGLVEVEDEDTTSVPAFILTPDDGKVPFVDGEALSATDGVYRYTPQTKDETVTINVTWRSLCTVRFDLNGGEGTAPTEQNVFVGSELLLPDGSGFSKKNAIFVGWSDDPAAESGFSAYTPERDTVLYAIYIPRTPLLRDPSNIAANSVESVRFEPLDVGTLDELASTAAGDPVFLNTAVPVYAFEITASDSTGNGVSTFENGIFAEIPKYVYDFDSVESGAFLRLYREMSDGTAEYIPIEIETDSLYFTAYADGHYILMKNTPDIGKYTVRVRNKNSVVYADLFYSGPSAQGGFFALRYDSAAVKLREARFADTVFAFGEEGFGVAKRDDENGIFSDVWRTKTPTDTEKGAYLGSLIFDVLSEGADGASESFGFRFASADDAGFGTLEGYPTDASGAYIPYCESTSVYYQPTDFSVQSDRSVASIGATGYETLEAALDAAEVGDTVVLFESVELNNDTAVPNGVKLSIVDGCTITLKKGVSLKAAESLYGFLTADTLIGENIENGVYTYTPSAIANDILINDGVQIRLSGTQGLRFILTLSMNRDSAESLFTDFGAVVIPTAMAEGENTTLSTARVGVVSKKALGDDFRYFTLSDSSVSYTACIIGTPPAGYDRRFTVRPYAVYLENGIEYTVYGEYDVRYDLSILDIAKAFSEDPACAEDMKKILDDYENATAD